MEKTTLTIDLTKIDKSRIETRTYTNREGVEVTVKDYKIDVVPLKQPRALQKADGTLIAGDTWQLMETHFACESQTKEEREANKETVYIGKGVQFQDKNPAPVAPVNAGEDTRQAPEFPEEEINPDDIPF
jgi:single-stranded DNA-binding protein